MDRMTNYLDKVVQKLRDHDDFDCSVSFSAEDSELHVRFEREDRSDEGLLLAYLSQSTIDDGLAEILSVASPAERKKAIQNELRNLSDEELGRLLREIGKPEKKIAEAYRSAG